MTAPLFLYRLAHAWPSAEWQDVVVVVAVSGGADSTALLKGLAELHPLASQRLVAAHYHHGVRGAEADGDETFVAHLATSLKIPFYCKRADDSQANFDTGDGFEAAARAARYDFLLQTARSTGARFVAVAHTADDRAETILQRILRGAGLSGLMGIPRTRELGTGITLIRPLLEFRRDEVRDYLCECGQNWREDASNLLFDYTRNRIRHDLLPKLAQDYNAAVVDALLRLGDLASEAQLEIQGSAARQLKRGLLYGDEREIRFDTTVLRGLSLFLVCEVFIELWRTFDWPRQRYGRDDWRRLALFATDVQKEIPKLMLPAAVLAERDREQLILRRTPRAS
jgi:tRNA(Ile)-lysidine synthase